jgi:hypothetical protein
MVRRMIGRAVHESGATLGLPDRGHFYSTETVFHVTVGRDYPVIGMGVFETVLLALVCDDTEEPNWLPIGVFELQSEALPADWEFVLLDSLAASGGDASNRWVAVWGYRELVHDRNHREQLVERDAAALEIFFRELATRTQ